VRAPALLEALLLLHACQAPRPEKPLPAPPARRASAFVCRDGVCRQTQPRLPDNGEWRCAERGRVVWCAGGEAAAGVVPSATDTRFSCGPRRGHEGERVCIDRSPDYPDDAPYHCSFEQELGTVRVCKSDGSATAFVALPAHAKPMCWLDRDCAAQRCDRGTCTEEKP